jgi:hypothetical protein
MAGRPRWPGTGLEGGFRVRLHCPRARRGREPVRSRTALCWGWIGSPPWRRPPATRASRISRRARRRPVQPSSHRLGNSDGQRLRLAQLPAVPRRRAKVIRRNRPSSEPSGTAQNGRLRGFTQLSRRSDNAARHAMALPRSAPARRAGTGAGGAWPLVVGAVVRVIGWLRPVIQFRW